MRAAALGDHAKQLTAAEQGAGKENMGKSDAGSNAPKTFFEMFQFNLVVMGNGVEGWILYVLDSFDVLVTQVMSAPRLLVEIIV